MKTLLVLTGHFFNRIFQNEVFPFEDQLKERLYMAGALLTALGGFVANSLFMKYMFWEDKGTSWQEKTFFLAFFMAVLAVLVVLDWDILFPDPKDYANLMVLPLRLRTLFGAKFLSFLVFIGLYTAAVNPFAVCVVAFFLPKWKSDGDMGYLFQYMAAHLLASAAAFLFVFFLFVLVHALLLLLLPPRAFKRISLFLRFTLLAVLVFGMMAFVVRSPVLHRVSDAILAAKEAGGARAAVIPPLWFTGLYETILGSRDPVFRTLAGWACGSTAGLALLYFAAMGLSYRRHLHRTPEFGNGDRMWRVRDRWLAVVERLASRDRTQQAVVRFVFEGLRTSSRHRLQLAGFIALAFGLNMIFLTSPRPVVGAAGLPSRDILAAPLVVAFFLIVALRLGFSTPISAEANWIFRLTEGERRSPYHAATRKAIAVFALIPLALGTTLVSLLLWPPGPALLHGAYVLVVALFLVEIIFDKFAKVPFACLSVPGRSRLQFFWMFYVLGFVFFVAVFGSLERRLFAADWTGFAGFFAAAGLVLAAIWRIEQRRTFEELPLVYEETPERVMVTLSGY